MSIPSVFLLQSFITIKSIYLGFNEVSWYISTLMFCYFISTYFYVKVKNIRLNNLINTVIVIYILQFSIVFIGKDIPMHHWLFYINPLFRSIDFLIGMILCRIFMEYKNNKIYNISYTFIEISLLVIFGMVYYLARYVPKALRWGVYYTPIVVLIILIFAKEEGIISKFLGNDFFMKLASISFEFYMVHQIVITNLSKYFIENQLIGIFIMLFTSLILSIVINHIFNYIDEKDKIKKIAY